ncbi:MAG: NAD-dependent epimerase/dehydratase family protein [Planctomycetaceae bacterium]|nr:NAD-dependent epimerase/dehydratase family protein [Planctomycetaceae bacterium]
MKLVLTGATGLLGNNVARLAVAAGHEVVCPVRRLGDRSLVGVPVSQVLVDFEAASRSTTSESSKSVWDELVAGCDAVIHSAALIHIGWQRQAESHAANVELTEQIAASVQRAGVRLIHISTVDTLAYSVNGQPVSEDTRQPAKPSSAYVRSKTAAEVVVKNRVAQGLDGVILHPGFMLGPWDWKPSSGKMLWAIAKRQIPLAPAGGCSAVDVRDVAQGVLNAVLRGGKGQHYILAGHNLSYVELFREIAVTTSARPPRWRVGPVVAALAGWFGDVWTRINGQETDLNSALVRMGQLRHYYSSDKAVRELGYQISPLQPALAAAWQFLQSCGDPPK